MPSNAFSKDALILVGHGSTLNQESGAPVFQHAAELRRRQIFVEVHEGFWKQEPRIQDVLRDTTAARVFLVPLFISEGYFSDRMIPSALGFGLENSGGVRRLKQVGDQTLIYCLPVGTHPEMTNVLLARAREVIHQAPFPRAPAEKELTLFLVGHGTNQNENSRTAAERQVELLRAMSVYADVHAVFMEEEPRIAACYELARTKNIVVVPFLISEGLHGREDIPILLGEPEALVKKRLENRQPTWRNPTEKRGKLVWYASSVGTAPVMAEVILARVREAGGEPSAF